MNYHFDIKSIRENPQAFEAAMKARGHNVDIKAILAGDIAHRQFLTAAQELQSKIKDLSRQIGAAMKAGDTTTADSLKSQVEEHKNNITIMNYGAEAERNSLNELLLACPNIASDDAPDGPDETTNLKVREWWPGSKLPEGYPHWELDVELGFDVAAKVSGSRFNMMMGPVARLHRALGQFMLDCHQTRGFKEVIPPTIVNKAALYGTGQLPKFSDDLFAINAEGEPEQYLIPTAEVSLTNIHADEVLIPTMHRYMALTECYRAEAGSAGRDTRGLIRQHQFQKVELVSICHPDQSETEHYYIVESSEAILEALELPYRRMLLSKGDMGFSARKTWDLEVWMPGQDAFREISSISNCGDFQARRMNTRYKIDGKTVFAHTLNGSGLAVGRTLAAVLENYQEGDNIRIPEVLRQYLGYEVFLKDL